MKIGIMSFAHLHAEAYIGNLRAAPGVEMIGIADESLERGTKYAQMFGAHLFDSYEALLAARPDAVLVCSENSRHRPLVEMAAQAGCHILCEKPLATTIEDARAILDACRRAGVILGTAFPVRFSPAVELVKKRLENGEFGDLYCFNAANNGQLPLAQRAWFIDPVLAGGGAAIDHIVHLADLFRWYTGSEVREVYAQMNRVFHQAESQVETGGQAMLTFENGVFATLDFSWSRPDYWPSWGGLDFEMVTQRGAVTVDAFKQNITVFNDSAQRPRWDFWGSDMNQALINDFVAAVQAGREPRVTGLDGFRAVEVVLAAYESARSGQPARVQRVEW